MERDLTPKRGRPRTVRDYANCKLPESRRVSYCARGECNRCGWNRDEFARRHIEMCTHGLAPLPNGLRGLVVHKGARL